MVRCCCRITRQQPGGGSCFGRGAAMIATAFLVFLFVWVVPVWLPVLAGLLLPRLRPGARLALVAAGVVSGLYASLGRTGDIREDVLKLVLLPLPTVVLSLWMMVCGLCAATAHHHIRENNAATPACVLSIMGLLVTLPLGPLALYPYLDFAMQQVR